MLPASCIIIITCFSTFPFLLHEVDKDKSAFLLNLQFHAAFSTMLYMACIHYLRKRRHYSMKTASYASLLSCSIFACHVSRGPAITDYSLDSIGLPRLMGHFLTLLGICVYLKLSTGYPKTPLYNILLHVLLYLIIIIQAKDFFVIALLLLLDNFTVHLIIPKRTTALDAQIGVLFILSGVSVLYRYQIPLSLNDVPHMIYLSVVSLFNLPILYDLQDDINNILYLEYLFYAILCICILILCREAFIDIQHQPLMKSNPPRHDMGQTDRKHIEISTMALIVVIYVGLGLGNILFTDNLNLSINSSSSRVIESDYYFQAAYLSGCLSVLLADTFTMGLQNNTATYTTEVVILQNKEQQQKDSTGSSMASMADTPNGLKLLSTLLSKLLQITAYLFFLHSFFVSLLRTEMQKQLSIPVISE